MSNPSKGTVTIEVEGGCVTFVEGLPKGWDYIIVDHDDIRVGGVDPREEESSE